MKIKTTLKINETKYTKTKQKTHTKKLNRVCLCCEITPGYGASLGVDRPSNTPFENTAFLFPSKKSITNTYLGMEFCVDFPYQCKT